MGKVASFFERQKNNMRDVYINYAATILTAVFFCVVMVIKNHNRNFLEGINIELILALVFIWNLFFETILSDRRDVFKKRLVLFSVGLAFSIVWDIILEALTENQYIATMYVTKIITVFMVIFVGMSLFIIIRRQKLDFEVYAPRAVFGILQAVGLFGVLSLASILILSLFDILIVEIDYWDFVSDIEILLCGLVYLPVCLMKLIYVKEDNSRFTKGFVKFALMPCVMIAMAIIYMYIIKIIITWDMPSNEIFNICAAMFAICVPIWTMARGFTKDSTGIYAKLISIMKYIYAPFILLEIYAIGVRIHEYGFTEARYAAVMFIIFQLVYILWEVITAVFAKFKRKISNTEDLQNNTNSEGTVNIPIEDETDLKYGKSYEYLILVLLGLVFIGILTPFINAQYVSYVSQKKILHENINAENNKASAAMRYLYHYNDYGRRYVEKNYSKSYIEEVISTKYPEDSDEEKDEIVWTHIYYNDEVFKNGLETGGYDRIYRVDYNNDDELSYGREFNIRFDADTKLQTDSENNCISANIEDSLSYFIRVYSGEIEKEEKPYTIYIGRNEDGTKEYELVVSQVYLSYSDVKGAYNDINISGYLLERNIGGTENE